MSYVGALKTKKPAISWFFYLLLLIKAKYLVRLKLTSTEYNTAF